MAPEQTKAWITGRRMGIEDRGVPEHVLIHTAPPPPQNRGWIMPKARNNGKRQRKYV